MTVTISNDNPRAERISRDHKMMTGLITFDSSYPAGGETITENDLKIRDVLQFNVNSASGYSFEWDYANNKLKVFASAPPVIWEEVHTIASNQITLNYPAAWIQNVAASNDNIALVSSGSTLATGECKPAVMAAGTRTVITFHSGLSGTILVSYITQAWKDVWDSLVQDEQVTLASGVGDLANTAIAIMSIGGTGDGNWSGFLDKDDTPTSAEVAIDWTNTSLTTITALSTTTSNDVASVTYLKKGSAGDFLFDRWQEEETATLTNSTTQDYDFPILLWGYTGQHPVVAIAPKTLINRGGTNGANEAYIDWLQRAPTGTAGRIRTVAVSTAATTGTYVMGFVEEIPGLVKLEIPDGTDISSLAIRYTAIGRK